ncbi:hypothetical protein [Lentzea nigeriaca]|uniref:hypothetical protein n=1 Tax=Lentzea nigeriaca TaxID=1128665 RepID=UPI0019583BCD|nr:hypothetical protein [Lentzea nigeriaca]MBM7860023.1 hypothetical protein [Lentzea nigeriaca]
MIRKTTAAALVLSAVPAALAVSLFCGTAQADNDTPWGRGITVPGVVTVPGDDTPWGKGKDASDDTPWGRGVTVADNDTPWG